MRYLVRTIFEMGQSVPENKTFDSKSYLPGRTAVTKAVKDLSHKYRQDLHQN